MKRHIIKKRRSTRYMLAATAAVISVVLLIAWAATLPPMGGDAAQRVDWREMAAEGARRNR